MKRIAATATVVTLLCTVGCQSLADGMRSPGAATSSTGQTDTKITLIDVVGSDFGSARQALKSSGLSANYEDANAEAGSRNVGDDWIVTAQTPKAGTLVNPEALIRLTVMPEAEANGAAPPTTTTPKSSTPSTTTPPPPPPPPPTSESAPESTFKKIDFTGSGDDVLTIPAHPDSILAVDANYNGESNFVIQGDEQLLVNTIGSYSGSTILDLYSGEATTMLEVNASGPWTISVRDVFTSPTFGAGKLAKGSGDLVYLYTGPSGVATINHQGESNFVVQVVELSSSDIDLAVNTIGNYSGKVPFAGGSIVVVQADGNWVVKVA